jgi:hypothetical protein
MTSRWSDPQSVDGHDVEAVFVGVGTVAEMQDDSGAEELSCGWRLHHVQVQR